MLPITLSSTGTRIMARGSIGLSPELNDYIVKAHAAEHPVLAKLREKTGSYADG